MTPDQIDKMTMTELCLEPCKARGWSVQVCSECEQDCKSSWMIAGDSIVEMAKDNWHVTLEFHPDRVEAERYAVEVHDTEDFPKPQQEAYQCSYGATGPEAIMRAWLKWRVGK